MVTNIIDREQVLYLFDIDKEAGKFFWKNPPKNHWQLLGTEAGCATPTHSKTYWVIKVGGKAFKRGRLMFLVAYGFLPEPTVDHEDGNSLNDRPGNLREATGTENARNHKHRAKKQNLPMGVRRLASGKFQPRIGVNKKQIHLGSFDTPEEAEAVYLTNRKEHFHEFA